MASPIRAIHLATDHLIEPTLSHLTGSSIEISGLKVDGRPYSDRLLQNVSFVPARGGRVLVQGLDPQSGGVRQFDLSGVRRMRVDGLLGPLTDDDLRPVLDQARSVLQERSSSSVGGSL